MPGLEGGAGGGRGGGDGRGAMRGLGEGGREGRGRRESNGTSQGVGEWCVLCVFETRMLAHAATNGGKAAARGGDGRQLARRLHAAGASVFGTSLLLLPTSPPSLPPPPPLSLPTLPTCLSIYLSLSISPSLRSIRKHPGLAMFATFRPATKAGEILQFAREPAEWKFHASIVFLCKEAEHTSAPGSARRRRPAAATRAART